MVPNRAFEERLHDNDARTAASRKVLAELAALGLSIDNLLALLGS